LFKNDATKGLNNKCLNIRDGDSHLEAQTITDYSAKYDELNPAENGENRLLNVKKNIYTFEVDCFFLPDPTNPSSNNIDYLKLILHRFKQDGDYFKNDSTFTNKITAIDNFNTEVQNKSVDKDKFKKLFDDILGHEVSKPSISLYLSSLLKAKLLADPAEIATWNGDAVPDSDSGVTPFNDLPAFIIPKYIQDGILWLITEQN